MTGWIASSNSKCLSYFAISMTSQWLGHVVIPFIIHRKPTTPDITHGISICSHQPTLFDIIHTQLKHEEKYVDPNTTNQQKLT
jgi:hypothetical protein